MVIPVGPQQSAQALYLVEKRMNGLTYESTQLMGVMYVPLVKGLH